MPAAMCGTRAPTAKNLVATAMPIWPVALSLAMIDQVILNPLPLPAHRGAETSKARSERVGVRGCERVGVRGCLREDDDRRVRGISPSPVIQAALEFRPLPASG